VRFHPAAAALIAIPIAAGAGEMGDYAAEIAEASKRYTAQGIDLPASTAEAPSRASLQNILDAAQRIAATPPAGFLEQDIEAGEIASARVSNVPAPEEVVLFVSWSMGRHALSEALTAASATGMTVLFRGIPEGENFVTAFRDIHSLVPGVDPVPNVLIDPPRWADWGIDTVPTMVMAKDGAPVAQVSGLTEPGWLLQAVVEGRRGNLGTLGPTEAPSERDLILVMQEKAAAIDWNQKKESAVSTYWERAAFQDLPPVTQTSDRRISLASRVMKDIVTPAGEIVARAGDVVDPLRARPFTRRLVIFDATDRRQVEFAANEARLHRNAVLMVSALDREGGWDGLRKLEDHLDAPVYLLTSDVRDRFRLRSVPSVVFQSDSAVLTVSEVCLTCAD